jgi:small-conductance mechanosensitive channel
MEQIPPSVYIPLLYLVWVTVLLLVKKVLYANIRKVARKTRSGVDDIMLRSLDLPLVLLIFVGGAFVLDNIFQFSTDSELLTMADIAFKATAIIAMIIFFDRLFREMIGYYSERVPVLKNSRGVMNIIVRSVVIGLGILILLDNFGVSITPILASLGVGSLAVALALQPTLENFFSGIQLIMDRPIKVGHFIKLESGEEGYVTRIGWRSTRIRQLPNNTVVIPNKQLVNSRVLNYYYPETEMAVLVQVGVHYDSDLEMVERVTVEVGEKVLSSVQGGVPGFKPFIRYHTFNDFSIDLTVILRCEEFVDNYLVKHEFIKALKKRFDEEGIVIPYPIRTLDWNPSSDPVKLQNKAS